MKSKFLFLALAALLPLAGFSEEAKLGLGERRALKKYQDETYSKYAKAINEAAGFELPVEVNWDVIAKPGQAEQYNEDWYFSKIYFDPLVAAFKEITKDEMGKEALKTGLKKVTITHDPQTAPASNWENGLSFKDGVLAINFAPASNADDVKDRTDAIVKVVEAGL